MEKSRLLPPGLLLLCALSAPSATLVHATEQGAGNSLKTVLDFGAKGDGHTDDTDSIQKAVDSGVGDIVFPAGVYLVSRPIRVELDRSGPVSISGNGTARIVMAGAGPALRLMGTHQGTAGPATVEPKVWERQRMPLVDGIEILGRHPEASGIEAQGTMQLTITRVTVRSALHGIHLIKRNRNVVISECHLYDNRGVGLFLDGVNLHQINVTNCHISYNRRGGIVSTHSQIRNLQIGSCDIEGNMAKGSGPAANILIDAATESVREVSIVGCTIQHENLGPESANIRLLGPSLEQAHKVGHFLIADNAISNAGVNVHLRHVRGVTLVGNTVWSGGQYNLLVEGSSNIVVGPNLFDRNPDYRPYSKSKNGLLFRDSRDCTLSGLHINQVLGTPAALILERCQWFNVTNCTILDSDGCGLMLRDVQNSRVSGCIIRSGSKKTADSRPICISGGQGNQIVDNLLSTE